ncbi:hypothetical protein DL769_005703 [Monosporascus sp. CRB-8-3]|nr:hypothetical protein DL769_005703 [Monosporascus sp. CRB-8-3]
MFAMVLYDKDQHNRNFADDDGLPSTTAISGTALFGDDEDEDEDRIDGGGDLQPNPNTKTTSTQTSTAPGPRYNKPRH